MCEDENSTSLLPREFMVRCSERTLKAKVLEGQDATEWVHAILKVRSP